MRTIAYPRDPRKDRRPSAWLASERASRPGTKACRKCKGTGRSGWVTAQGATVACPGCNGFGY
jgi:hypothetical protein